MKSFYSNRTNKVVSVFLALIFLGPFQGCRYYYKVQTVNKVTPQEIRKYDSLNKYLILHQGDSAWHLERLAIHDTSVTGEIAVLPDYRYMFLNTNPKGGNRYRSTKKYNEDYVLEEVHLYVTDKLVPNLHSGDNIILDCSAIRKAEVYKKASGRTTASWVIPAVVPILIIGGVILIAALSKSSCPLIYIKKDNNFDFAGEIFGGAVYSSLERHDYLPLPGFKPSKNQYKLIISNGLPEIQYINLAELWIVKHPGNMTVLPDRHGIVHSIARPEVPIQAKSLANSDILPLLNKKDRSCFLFDEEPSQTGDS
jgi:hypothetical protein